MAIRDIFWACPLCRTPGGLVPNGRRESCATCGAFFVRGPAATIQAHRNGSVQTRPAADWLRDLGEPEIPMRAPGETVLGPEPVIVCVASQETPIRFGGELLGWREVFGPKTPAHLTLTTDMLRFDRPNDSFSWRLDSITVVQPSSSALQIAAGKTVASVKFPRGSLRLWSRAITTTLRRHASARGCEIVEFQPMIRTRPARG